MSDKTSTRLRSIKSKDLEGIMAFVESLPHKIEHKHGPEKVGPIWYLFFTIPDNASEKVPFITDLDR